MAGTSRTRGIAAVCAGVATVGIATGVSLDGFEQHPLSIHMVRHLLLSAVGAPLLLIGLPAVPMRRIVPERVVGALGRPLRCWTIAMAVFVGWHIPALFALAHRSEGWLFFQHATFLASGILFWWPVVEPLPRRAPWPRWSMVLYLFLATLPCDGLSAFLAFSDRAVYSTAMGMAEPHHPAAWAIDDQQRAGAIMWMWVTLTYSIPAAVILTRMLACPIEGELDDAGVPGT
jgi:cytochrome c oxidase assembly factor CtaG